MSQETKICKHCQSEIPKKAKVCPQCRKKQGGKLKWIIIGVVVILIIGAAAGGGDDEGDSAKSDAQQESKTDNTETKKKSKKSKKENQPEVEETAGESVESEPAPESEAEPNQDEANRELTVGSSFEKNGLKITVNSADLNFQNYSDDYGMYTPAEGMRYVMASFTFENSGKSDAYVSIYDFDCYADNASCEQAYLPDDSDFINTNLSPGRNISFQTYYQVPVNAGTIELEYETSFWTNEKAVIKLQ